MSVVVDVMVPHPWIQMLYLLHTNRSVEWKETQPISGQELLCVENIFGSLKDCTSNNAWQ